MRIRDFQRHFEQLVPPAIAWKSDNVGLLLGRGEQPLTNLLIALDLTEQVAQEAIRKKANCIVTHHPFLFHPLKNITASSRTGRLALFLAEHRLNVYAAHTNLDSVPWGVSGALAASLGLTDIQVLSPLKEGVCKIVVFVPHEYLETVAGAMHEAGGGMFAKYDRCSFRSDGTGTFRGKANAKPFLGSVGVTERAKEVRLEILVVRWHLQRVIDAMLAAHPYEEVAYDIYPLDNRYAEAGLGAIGTLPKPMTQRQWLKHVQQSLGVKGLRFSGTRRSIRRVAVCGGSGTDLIPEAVAQHADAMVTADLKFHVFQEFEEKILLIDAGHYETERAVLPVLARTIDALFRQHGHRGKVFVTQQRTNPVQLFF